MLCPDMNDAIKNYYRLKNLYEHYEDRISFSVDIITCPEDEDYCASMEDIEKLVSKIYVTEYLLHKKFDRRKESENATMIRLNFLSQFELDMD